MPNISRGKGNQTMKSGQLIECWLSKYIEGYRNILKLSSRPLAFISYYVFLKNKKRSGTSHPVPFSASFLKKMLLLLYCINWPSFIIWLPLLHEILGYMYIAIDCYPGCNVMNFEDNLIFLIKPFFLHEQKVKIKS